MNHTTRNAVIALAREQAAEWFPLDVEADLPDLVPDHAWDALNERFTDNAKQSHNCPTEIDRLFELAYRQDMARRWLAETTRRLEEMSK